MKSILIGVLIIICIIISGCTNTIGGGILTPGIYIDNQNPSNFVTVNDKNFIQEFPMAIYFGTYTMGGDMITVEGDCKEDKSLGNIKLCGNKFIRYYKMSGNNTFCQVIGKDGSTVSGCYALKSP